MPTNDIHELSEGQLKLSYWFIVHKFLIKKVITIVLTIFDIGILLYACWGLVSYFLITFEPNRIMMSEMAQNLIEMEAYKQRNKPLVLEVGNIDVFSSGSEKYDFVVQVKNPNEKWLIKKLTYKFIIPNVETEEHSIYLLPNQEKYIFELGVEKKGGSRDIEVQLVDVNWKRIYNFTELNKERNDFSVDNIKFSSARELNIKQGKLPISNLNFTIKNNSIYNYWIVDVYIVLEGGGKVAGINYLTIDKFKANEERSVSVNWLSRLPTITKVEILPTVNIYDQENYMEVSGDLEETF